MKHGKTFADYLSEHKKVLIVTVLGSILVLALVAAIMVPALAKKEPTETQSTDMLTNRWERPSASRRTIKATGQTVDKVIKYEDLIIEIPEIEVAKVDSAEDPDNAPTAPEKKEEQPEVQPETIEEVDTDCFANVSYGIDVSSHQEKIDWKKVKADGVEFAIIRCGYRGYESGKIVLDACFDYNITNAYKNGIKIGIYFYSSAISTDESVQEAAWIDQLLKTYTSKGIKIEYPIAYDFEEFDSHPTSRANGQTKEQVTDNALAYLDYLNSCGYKVMHYCSKYSRYERWDAVRLSKYDFWLAHYCEATDYKGSYVMWQYTSMGKVDGINGGVDMDISGTRTSEDAGSATFVICEKDNISAHAEPNAESEVVCVLEKDTVYDCLKTYAKDWSELYINGIYVYVRDTDITPAVGFVKCDTAYEAAGESLTYYTKCSDAEANIAGTIEKEIKLQGVGIYKDQWLKITYESYPYYVKTADVKEYVEPPVEEPDDDTSSDTSEQGDTSSEDENSSEE
ncbi:MAG: glycoside hydrolase family 25 protein [Clostridiales bacterium]|nr:glycoside hydrolase family 25 protein [Candidatus Equinaster intestinalis]